MSRTSYFTGFPLNQSQSVYLEDIIRQIEDFYGDTAGVIADALDARDQALDAAQTVTSAVNVAVTARDDALVAQQEAQAAAYDAAQALGQSALKDQNLSDLTNLKEARANLGTFSTVADVQNSHIPPVFDIIRTNGYYDPGDGSGALYVRVDNEPSHNSKVQSSDGSWWSPVIPFGYVFDSVADMQASRLVTPGARVRTLGYYSPGDGGGGDYEIVVAGTGTDDGGSFINLSGSGLQAKLLFSDRVSGVAFGMRGDGTTDDTTALQNALNALSGTGGTVYLPIRPKGYPITTVRLPPGVGIEGEGAKYILHTLHDWDKTEETCQSTWLKASGPVNTPMIEMSEHSSVKNLRMIDLRQKFSVSDPDEAFNDTQIAIQFGYAGNYRNHGQSVTSVSFFGFKRFMKQWVSGSNKQAIEKLRVHDCHGIPFECALDIAHSSDTVWIDECHFNYNSVRGIRDESLVRPTAYNLAKKITIFRLGQADGIRFNNVHAMHCRSFITFYRDAYTGDINRGGGFAITNGGADVCHRGIEFLRDGANSIGGSWLGGQIIPIVYIPGSENCAFYVENEPAESGKLLFDVTGVSIHTGGTNPTNLQVKDSNYLGPSSVKAPRWVIDMAGAHDTVINIRGGRGVSFNTLMVDPAAAYSNGNFVRFDNVWSWRRNHFMNSVRLGDGENADEGSFKYIVPNSDGINTHQIKIEKEDGTLLSKWEVGGTTTTIQSIGSVQLRPMNSTLDSVQLTGGDASEFVPFNDLQLNLGSPIRRWKEVFAGNGTISTSDEREKQQVRELTDAERSVALQLKEMIRAFKWNNAVDKKGEDGARIHFGVIAQQVRDVFEDHGLNAHDYGLFCYDEWPEKEAVVHEWDAEYDTEGNVIREAGSEVLEPYQPAGSRFGIRYEELLAFIISAL